MAEAATVNLPDVDPLPGPATSWAPGEAAPRAMDSVDKAGAGLADIKRKEISETRGATEDAQRGMRQGLHEVQKAYQAEGVGPDALKPWDAQKEAKNYQTDPIEAFGSLGSVFGILAASFTHAPMQIAFEASASAMNAIKENNNEGYKRAYTAWKDNNELAIKRQGMMHQQYQDATELLKTNMTLGQANLRMLAAKFGDQKMLYMLDHGMDKEIIDTMAARDKLATELQHNQEQRDLDHEKYQDLMVRPGFKALVGSPERRAAIKSWEKDWLPLEKVKSLAQQEGQAVEDLVEQEHLPRWQAVKRVVEARNSAGVSLGKEDAAEVSRRTTLYESQGIPHDQAFERARSEVAQISRSAKTGGQIAKEQEKKGKIESVVNQIDYALGLIEQGKKTGDTVTGAKGKIGTLVEWWRGTGEQHAEFEAIIKTIQQEAKPLLTGSTRSLLTKNDRADVDTIIPGLGFIRNETQAAAVLKNLRKILNKVDLMKDDGVVPLPERFADEPDGTEFPQKSTGRMFVKKGNYLVPKD
jgi:hypothetical protein